jgi:hypothetical protein
MSRFQNIIDKVIDSNAGQSFIQYPSITGQSPSVNTSSAKNTFTKVDGSFERKLSPELIDSYFTTQGDAANPLSPLEFQAQQQGGGQVSGNAFLPDSQEESPQAPGYADMFNTVMLDLLKKAQGVDTVELLKRKRALERASLDRASEATPEELRTLSPSQQSAIRSGNVKALSSEIDDNAYRLAKAEQQIDNFYRAFEATSKLGAEFAEKLPLPEAVKESFIEALQQRPTSDWGTILAGLNDKQKTEVLGGVDYSKLTETAAGDGKDFTLGEKQIRYDSAGNIIAQGSGVGSGGQGVEPSPLSEMVLANPDLLDEMTATKRGEILEEIANSGQQFTKQSQESSYDLVSDALATAEELIDHGGLDRAVAIANPLNVFPGTLGREWRVLAQTLISQISLPKLDFLRGLGAMSDKEFGAITSASSILAAASGNKFRDISEKKAREEINRIIDSLEITKKELEARGIGEVRIEVIGPDGTPGDIPESQLEEALAEGYQQVQQ